MFPFSFIISFFSFLFFSFSFYYFPSFLCLSLSSPSLLFTFTFFYFYPFFFLHKFKLYPKNRAILNIIFKGTISTNFFLSQLSWFTHDLLSYLVYQFYFTYFTPFFSSYTYTSLHIMCGYFTFKSNLMPATSPRKHFDPKRKFVFLPCIRAR